MIGDGKNMSRAVAPLRNRRAIKGSGFSRNRSYKPTARRAAVRLFGRYGKFAPRSRSYLNPEATEYYRKQVERRRKKYTKKYRLKKYAYRSRTRSSGRRVARRQKSNYVSRGFKRMRLGP